MKYLSSKFSEAVRKNMRVHFKKAPLPYRSALQSYHEKTVTTWLVALRVMALPITSGGCGMKITAFKCKIIPIPLRTNR